MSLVVPLHSSRDVLSFPATDHRVRQRLRPLGGWDLAGGKVSVPYVRPRYSVCISLFPDRACGRVVQNLEA